MIYDIRHVTRYAYEQRVATAKLALRLTPSDGGGQHRLGHALSVRPAPRQSIVERDFFGNDVTVVLIDTALTELRIEATARVEVQRPVGLLAGASPAWQAVAERALSVTTLDARSPVHFLYPSPRIALFEDITAYAVASFAGGCPIVDGARDLARRIRRDFAYNPSSTAVSTPLEEAFAQRSGVCQDFAHIMIAALRGLGLPAAYVSGYIRTIPPPGAQRLAGADASHAWVAVWCGPEIGWFGIDPTNAIDVGNDHIVLATGRDFSDVSPIYGVFLGSGAQALDVAVDVVPVEQGGIGDDRV
ncbi:transglutaminase family protein [Bradyrhizobium sp. WD16]|uniref:transglutaminase family protein n=1 Tax=Bradyrhizobium sp. WD16 TaxID=1521768 RepID=UPI0020A27E46|nr:transglutaminase family protein [Bradyrhizobium sp. WD16]UTD29961.1 transglutaminase [Bradyrhizobium sp. WD16]